MLHSRHSEAPASDLYEIRAKYLWNRYRCHKRLAKLRGNEPCLILK